MASTVVCCKVTFSDESSVGIINNAVCCNLPAVMTMLRYCKFIVVCFKFVLALKIMLVL